MAHNEEKYQIQANLRAGAHAPLAGYSAFKGRSILMIYTTCATADAVDKSNPSFANHAVAHCCKVWKKTFRESFAATESEVRATSNAAEAYRAAMPPLSTRDSCRDFIACVAQGMLLGAIPEKDGGKLLYAAQVALAAANVDRNSPDTSDPADSAPKRSRKSQDKRRSGR